jgi:hypothetical protein
MTAKTIGAGIVFALATEILCAAEFSAGVGAHGSASSAGIDSPANQPQIGAEQSSPPVHQQSAAATSGLIINATFDSSITQKANAAAIESAINQAIAIYQTLFTDPITVSILFRYANTDPNGTPINSMFVSRSYYVYYNVSPSTYQQALVADAKTGNDVIANATLPAQSLSTFIRPTSACGRAIGLNTPPAIFANGTVGSGGPYDGIVTLNSSAPIQFTRPARAGYYDAQQFIEHEIDEVLGLGSSVATGDTNIRPQDLFSWSAPGTRNIASTGVRYFSIDGGRTQIVGFNQNTAYDTGDWFSESCPQTHVDVQNAFACTGASADVTALSPEATNLDVIGYDLIAPNLANVSTRLEVLTDANVLIGGFILTGSDPKKVLLRAIGPSLPVTGALADPTLELHDSSGATIATNDNWKVDDATGQSQEDEIRATGIAPLNDAESALLATLPANNASYTAIVKGKSDTSGIGLVEVYDLAPTAASQLANISTRGFVDSGDNVMIGGFIAAPANTGPAAVLIRALGPSLPVPGALQDPTLELHDANGATLATNDNWRVDDATQTSQEDAIRGTGIPPGDDRESALLQSLPPGGYTAILRGNNNSSGVALVEVYRLK